MGPDLRMAAGIYLHIPFCKSRCSYCDFATDVWRNSEAAERYVAALCREIGSAEVPSDIDTIYFGGGTPSRLTPQQVETILEPVRAKFSVAEDTEITMEMNLATVRRETGKRYKWIGENRAIDGF